MKDTYTIKRTTELAGFLTKTDDGEIVVEVYDKKDEPPTIINFLDIIETNMDNQIMFKVVCEVV